MCVCTQTTINEWDNNNVLVTGSSDGIVRIWGVLFTRSTPGDSRGQGRTGDSRGHTAEKWVKTLIVRARLTMFTSFERPDNKHPADITCVR